MKTKDIVIGVSGKCFSGKSTIATILENVYGRYPKAFADMLKIMAAEGISEDSDFFFNDENKIKTIDKLGMTGRVYLQKMGRAMREGVHPDYWVIALYSDLGECRYVTIADVRLLNEVKFIKNQGGIIIRVNGDPTGMRAKRPLEEQMDSSETELDDYQGFDIVLENNGSIEELQKNLLEQLYLINVV